MKLIRKASGDSPQAGVAPWRVLVVDDDPFIHEITELSLEQFRYEGRHLELIRAYSGQEAREILSRETGIAVALVDVVMETDDAGLRLVDFIRQDLGDTMIRLVVRTGQAGSAPEHEVIERYDIDDYKDKTELTARKLFTTMRAALKAYRDIQTIDRNRRGLETILDAAPGLFLETPGASGDYYAKALASIVSLCQVNGSALMATYGVQDEIRATSGGFSAADGQERAQRINRQCIEVLRSGAAVGDLPENSLLVPLNAQERLVGHVYLEGNEGITETQRRLSEVMAVQVGAALKTHGLQDQLREANRQALYMLAVASEHKDEDTGAHIRRLREGTRLLALRTGLDPSEAEQYADASVLHDIGKLGVPDAILQKPGKLSVEEFSVIKRHPGFGENILQGNRWFDLARECSASHHERWDGSGYPRGLAGEQIPLIGRLVSVMDVFDALSHSRPYKPAWTIEDSVAEIERGSGAQFEPRIVEAFMSLFRDGSLARIV